jgi:hypothetical protein
MLNIISQKSQPLDADSPELVDCKVKGLLNKLTMEKFDSISDQIIAWANKSEKEKDGWTCSGHLVFEKATDEAAWSEMYARLSTWNLHLSSRMSLSFMIGNGLLTILWLLQL